MIQSSFVLQSQNYYLILHRKCSPVAMDKRKKRTGKPGRVVIEVQESQEITFEQFERTITKIVRTKPPKNNKGGGQSPQP